MGVADRASPARLKRRAVAAFVAGAIGIAAAVLWALELQGTGAVTVAPRAAGVSGREALAILVAVGATGVAFCLYGLVLAWVVHRIGTSSDRSGEDRA